MTLKISPELIEAEKARDSILARYYKYVTKITCQNTDNEMMGLFRKKRIKGFEEWLLNNS